MDAPGNGPMLAGRYAVFDEIGAGGMARVHIGKLVGAVGFSRTVAIKRMHPELVRDSELASMFVDEARLAARVLHPNVAATIDVVTERGELLIVMEYLHGESLTRLLRAASASDVRLPVRVVAAIVSSLLHGLHAAHEAKTELGEPLQLVHRDVSPHNVMVCVDGVARVVDFGVAKAVDRLQTTKDGRIRGKLAYMPPEQLEGEPLTRQADVYSAAVVLWEALTGRALFGANNEAAVVRAVLLAEPPPPSHVVPDVPPALDAILARGLARARSARYATARDMALALEEAVGVAPPSEVGHWVHLLVGDRIEARQKRIEEIDRDTAVARSLRASQLVRTLAEAEAANPGALPAAAPRTGSFGGATGVTLTATLPESPRAPTLSRRWVALSAGSAALVVLLTATGAAVTRGSSAQRSLDAPAARASKETTPEARPPPGEPPPARAPYPDVATPSRTEAAPVPLPPASDTAAIRAPSAARSRGTATTGAPPRSSCDPPWTQDATGRRTYKRECF